MPIFNNFLSRILSKQTSNALLKSKITPEQYITIIESLDGKI